MREKLAIVKEYLVAIILGFVAFLMLLVCVALFWHIGQRPPSCNVASMKLYGQLVYYPAESGGSGGDQTAAEDLRRQIEQADADSNIKAILLQIDSPGGDPVAGEDIAAALKHASKPTVALVADEGTSGAYWAATGARTIFASANSSVGDIGITQSYLQQTNQDKQNGLQFVSITAGQYKDMGNPDAPLTPTEKELMQRDINIIYHDFVNEVAQNRDLSVASVTAIADGSLILGRMALQDGLVDRIGGIYDVKDYLTKKIGTAAVVCEGGD